MAKLIQILTVGGGGTRPSKFMDYKSFEKEIADLNAEVSDLRIYRDKLLTKSEPVDSVTQSKIARHSRLMGEKERLEQEIAKIKGMGRQDGTEHEGDDHEA